MSLNRRGCMALAVLAAISKGALANDWPRRPIKLIVGGAPGSAPDGLARLIADPLGANLGHPVLVENRPGAGGQLAMNALVHSPADGYTLALATMSQAVFNSYTFSKLAYDPLRDLEPIATLVTGAMAMAVHPLFPAQSFVELIALAKARPKELFVALPGNGSPPHIVYLMLQKTAEFEMTTVPFRSGPDALKAVVSGQMSILMDGPATIAPQVAGGKLRALLVTGDRRVPSLPGVPTAAELGIHVRGEAWFGLVAPAGTPRQIVTRVNQEAARVLATPEVEAQIVKRGYRVFMNSPDAFARLIQDEHKSWGAAIREFGLKLDLK